MGEKKNEKQGDELNSQKNNSSNEEKPNQNINPPRFFNVAEGVNANKYSDNALKEKEKKNNG